jgi:hypothetical protein
MRSPNVCMAMTAPVNNIREFERVVDLRVEDWITP